MQCSFYEKNKIKINKKGCIKLLTQGVCIYMYVCHE